MNNYIYINILVIILVLANINYVKGQQLKFYDKTNDAIIKNVKITDNNNQTLAGETILLENLKEGVIYKAENMDYVEVSFSKSDAILTGGWIYMVPNDKTLSEIVITASKSKQNRSEVPYLIETIGQKEIKQLNAYNSAQLLESSGKAFVQMSQFGGGSPILRGFEANRVLLVVDGIRLNNAIYRSGHLQDIMTIDVNQLKTTEILYGPSSLLYGSDAIGGVIHLMTKSPKFLKEGDKSFNAELGSRYSSAMNERTGTIEFEYSGKNVANLTAFSYSSFGDLVSGKNKNPFDSTQWLRNQYVTQINGLDTMVNNEDPYKQVNSGYSQYNLLNKFIYTPGLKTQLSLNVQYSNTSNIPRFDRLTQIKNGVFRFAEWNYGPQKRLLVSPNFEYYPYHGHLFDKISFRPYYQTITQERITRGYRQTRRFTQTENVKVAGLNIDLSKSISSGLTHLAGLDYSFNDVKSVATELDIINNVKIPAVTRYPPGKNTTHDFALYSKWLYKLNNWTFDGGIRYQYRILKSRVGDVSFYPVLIPDFEQKNGAFAFNLGTTYALTSSNILKLGFSRGFRAPNLDDVGKIFDSSIGNVIVPSPEAKPETANSIEFTWENKGAAHSFYITPFTTYLQDAVIISPGTFNGSDSIVFQGTLSKVQVITNAAKANVYGIQAGFSIKLNAVINLSGNISYTKGVYQANNNLPEVPMDHIPPIFGSIKLGYEKKRINAGFLTLFNCRKKLKDYSTSGEDNLIQATPDGIPAWVIGNLYASYAFDHVNLGLGIDNILNTHFRTFASGINAPGRNFKVSLRYSL